MKYKHVPYIEQDCCTGCVALGDKDICRYLNYTCNDGIYVEDKEGIPDYPALLARCKPWLEEAMVEQHQFGYANSQKGMSYQELETLLVDLEKVEEKSECKQ